MDCSDGNYKMDTPQVDTDMREISTPAYMGNNSCVLENDHKRNVDASSTNVLLENSLEENETHNELYHDTSQAESYTGARCQGGQQRDLTEMKSVTNLPTTQSVHKIQMVDANLANMKQYGVTSANDSEINATTCSVIQQGQVRLKHLLKSISSARRKEDNPLTIKLARSRVPPKWVNFESDKFSMKRAPDVSSVYFEESLKPQKVISWREANSSRPSLRFDMDGPGPCTYSPRSKPLTETNAPIYSFGFKHCCENDNSSITSQMRLRLQSNDARNIRASHTGEQLWPSPNSSLANPILGSRQATMRDAPAYTFGHRRNCSFVRPEAHMDPSPSDYSRQKADGLTLSRGPSFTLQFRREGTLLWNTAESNPGPAAYSPVVLPKIRRPAYTIQGVRRDKSYLLAPYCST